MYHCLPLAFQLTCNYSAVWWGWCECGPVRRAGSETFPLCARQCTWHAIHKQRCKQHEYYLPLVCFWNAVYYIHNEFSTMNSHYSLVRWRCDAFGVRFVALRINQTVFNTFSSWDAFVTSLRHQSRRILQNPPSLPLLSRQSAPRD